ncbi:UDP-N-acetylmuramoyl-L-alanyl-D-glutamate--2,6-diaminopimelate ligase [Putridiphycobacter roseus]|uniref:UDP-N-acetylmuramoyl-L-alanyl-D-glutamate--2,6-diaminopimelate ligase n=1 Tax=Putridiphycobacter roseus TaxID=2219161 RepID=A0A2W1N4R0_9FLAO|nr:UDP-N-acetylmuramoyl-L-alanyl-D-glutamate--2,6-diaminopimelate ligase [Putridiphycobacter roseus]PZE18570.1 UDP-N-acetylmuramoyl-L-alanyl-D-glutamate--2,6-diaminopimelate ligase [Putridiphycobacter roseus]
MNNLKDILYDSGITKVNGELNVVVQAIAFDSREVAADSLFIAIKGEKTDGHQFIDKAIVSGAIAIVCEVMPENIVEGITYVVVSSSSYALGIIASNFYDHPSNDINLVGVTGTNGKTTTVTLLHDLFTMLGYHVGLFSTVVNKIGNVEIPATHTTPDPIVLNKLLKEMVTAGCEYCFMEVSSHAISQHRISGLNFRVAGFSNITHEHLDYHKTFKAYIKAKKAFFDQLSSKATAIVNIDDVNGLVMTQNTSATVATFGLKNMADYKVKIVENSFNGLVLNINNKDVWTRLIGGFNAYNLILVYAIAIELGLDVLEVLTGISKLKSVEGRFEYMKSDKGIIAIVDYAHTPDALANVLSTIAAVRTKNEKVITVVGCGGDRDKTKRPLMAKIAAENSDKIILTSDNPRSENPDEIILDMKKGIPVERSARVMAISDRAEAIKVACALAEKGDILLVAGKGHEKYQEINGKRFPFDDLEILKETLKNLQK